jgi:hypothetical protein
MEAKLYLPCSTPRIGPESMLQSPEEQPQNCNRAKNAGSSIIWDNSHSRLEKTERLLR